MSRLRSWLLGVGVMLLVVAVSPGDTITDADIVATDGNEIGSGNGTLDLLLLTESSGGSGNSKGGFDGDDACTDMPTGGGSTVSESYITSVGELRAFFDLNFAQQVHDIPLCVDLNQIKGGDDVTLTTLTVVVDYTANFGDDRDNPATSDITSALQNATAAGFSGGTVVASLDGPKVLPLNVQGAGWADYIIMLGIDPYDQAFSDSTRILFHWESYGHDDGGETIFLSGEYIPEPATAALLLVCSVAAIVRRRRRTR